MRTDNLDQHLVKIRYDLMRLTEIVRLDAPPDVMQAWKAGVIRCSQEIDALVASVEAYRVPGYMGPFSVDDVRTIKQDIVSGMPVDRIAFGFAVSRSVIYAVMRGDIGAAVPWPDGSVGALTPGVRPRGGAKRPVVMNYAPPAAAIQPPGGEVPVEQPRRKTSAEELEEAGVFEPFNLGSPDHE